MTLGMVHEWFHSGSATFALRLVCGISAVWLAAALAAMVLRQSSAALRHRVWSLSMGAALVLPALVAVLPEWRVGAISLPSAQETPATPAPAAIAPAMPPLPERAAGQPLRIDPPPVETLRVAQSAAQEISSVPAAARADAPPRPAPPMNWTFWFWLAWLIPALWLILCQATALLAARNLVRRSTPLDDRPAAECLSRLMGRLSIRARPRLLENGQLGSPMCLGQWRPAILLPADWRDWHPTQLEAVLTHELAHVARRDVLWQTLARLACALYWFHPLAWVAVWRLRVERELACDDWVLRGGESSTRYARWLLEAATRLLGREPHAAERIGVAMAARSGFEKRIRAILDPHRRRYPVSRPTAVILALSAAAFLGAAGMLSPLAAEKVVAGEVQASAATQPAAAPDRVRFTGRVEDEAGRAVEGVIVEADEWPKRPRSAQTGPDGRFVLEARMQRLGQTLHARTPDGTRQGRHSMAPTQADQVSDIRIVLRPARELAVAVNDEKGQPIADASVGVVARGRLADEAVSDAAGKALLHAPADEALDYVFAVKPAVGLDYTLFWRKDQIRSDPYRLEPDHRGPMTLVLNGTKTVKVRVVDAEQRPLPGVNVYPWYVQKPRKGGSANLSGLPQFFGMATNDDGVAEFRTIPVDNTGTVVFWPTLDGYTTRKRCLWDAASGQNEVTVQLLRQVPVIGRVLDADGRAVGGATVQVVGESYEIDGFRGETRSAEDGSFQIDMNADMYYMFIADKGRLVSPRHFQTIRRQAPAAPIELTLQPGTRVHGRITAGREAEPLPGASVGLIQQDDGSHFRLFEAKGFPGQGDGRRMRPLHAVQWLKADPAGQFEFFIAPGEYQITSNSGTSREGRTIELSEDGTCIARRYDSDARQWLDVPLKVSKEQGVEVNLHMGSLVPPVPDLKGRVVLRGQAGTGVADAVLTARPLIYGQVPIQAASDRRGSFTLPRERWDLLVHAASADGKLRGTVQVGKGEAEAVIPIGPTASASGRLIEANGQVAAHRTIEYGVKVDLPGGAFFHWLDGTTTTGDDGSFAIDGLVLGCEYRLQVVNKFGDRGWPRLRQTAGTVKPGRPERVELGDLKLPSIDLN